MEWPGNESKLDSVQEDMAIKPGFRGLNLSVMVALDTHLIDNAKSQIEGISTEHNAVENVHKIMIALLKTKIPREQMQARHELENILKNSPNNLNALADLEHIYQELNRKSDADLCRKKIDCILSSNTEEDVQIKQLCLLEQGYAILIERTLINENTVEKRILELQNILDYEQKRSDGKRKECFERSLHYQFQVLRNVKTANDESNRNDPHLQRKESCLKKFEAAESLSSLPEIWIFYLGRALNEYYSSLETVNKMTKDTLGIGDSMRITTLKALEKFWHVITHLDDDDDVMVFKARSYAYIGHILTRRKDLILERGTSDWNPEFLNEEEFKAYLNDPIAALRQAYEWKPNDTTVLNRYGRALWNKSMKIDRKEPGKLEFLEKSEEMFSASIKIDNTSANWWAFSCRMHARLYIADAKSAEEQREYLEKAKNDGLICFNSSHTRFDMTLLAEACEKLAKFPKIQDYGPEFVVDKELLNNALDYLFHANCLGDQVDYKWTHQVAACLYDLGEYEQAIEWQRKAWFLSSPSSLSSFTIICKLMLTMFEERNVWTNTDNHLFRELLYVMIYAKNKYKDIKYTISNLYYRRKKEFYRFLYEILCERHLSLRSDEKDMITLVLETFIDRSRGHGYHEKFIHLKNIVDEVIPAEETEFGLEEIVQNLSMQPLLKEVQSCSKRFKYDFFVSHSHKDGNWVDNILLWHLERKLDDQDMAFKGCIAYRDFTPGKSVVDNIVDAIKQSYKVIIILTKHFVSSKWCQYEANQVIIKSMNIDSENGTGNCIIPVLLEECNIPDKIKHINYVDMTDKHDFKQEIERLKKALLPDDEKI